MFGWINDCTEALVISKFGLEKWHEIKQKAGCNVKDHGFVRHQYYPDSSTVKLVVAASEVLGIPVDGILEAFGQFFMEFVRSNGYENLLRCQGSTLRLWLSNLNALHDHLQSAMPGNSFVAPVFWCEDEDDDVNHDGSILLHYFSKRGSLLVPLVVGVVKEVAVYHFGVEVEMERLNMQDEDGSEFTTWRINAVNPNEQWKLTKEQVGQQAPVQPQEEENKETKEPLRCPFSGMSIPQGVVESLATSSSDSKCPVNQPLQGPLEEENLRLDWLQKVFPFHVLVDREFCILQVGSQLPALLSRPEEDICGSFLGDVLVISRPVLAGWNWPTLRKLADQTFFITPKDQHTPSRRGSSSSEKSVTLSSSCKFKGSMIDVNHDKVMFVLSPDAKNVSELAKMGLVFSDLPLHSFQRDAVFLGEHIASEVRSAHRLDKLSKRLENEKNLSNTLLYNMLPRTVADDLRAGRTVEPAHYENVTLFFSDVVGFTTICERLQPWDVVDLLNRLYSVMDYLATRFNLYKVETIGDAYMCCSGLPIPDEKHAENIANFAIAVKECVKHVRNPVDGKPIELRIGMHTGNCMAGVVGTLTPHYCLFGDMVNTTARHESTGQPGRIQCSSVLYGRLKHFSSFDTPQYEFTPRGLVAMKGKGEQYTYWLNGGTPDNSLANHEYIKNIYKEVGEMLDRKGKKRRYFRRASTASVVSGGSGSTGVIFDNVSVSKESTTSKTIETNTTAPIQSPEGSEASTEYLERSRNIEDDLNELADFLDEHGNAPELQYEDPEAMCNTSSWPNICWKENLSREDLVGGVHELLSRLLTRCIQNPDEDPPENMDVVDGQLYGFVHAISNLYVDKNRFHSWQHACHVVLGASYLMERAQEEGDQELGLDADPWLRFTVAFAGLIHDIKHLGVPNKQLESEGHPLCQVYENGSWQERQSKDIGLSIFVEEFPELSRMVLKGCPMFLRLVSLTVLATDVSSGEVQRKSREKFEWAFLKNSNCEDFGNSTAEKTEAALEHLTLIADVGHCAQKYETFLKWNRAFYEECLVCYLTGRGTDPRDGWFKGQIWFLENYVLPLAERCNKLVPQCGLKSGVERNLKTWRMQGQAWTDKMIEELHPDKDGNVSF